MTTTPIGNRTHVDLDDEAARWLDVLREARTQLDEWQRIVDAASDKVKAVMGDAEEAYIDGKVAARWTFVNTSRIDTKKLEAEHPEIAESFRVPQVIRRFSLPDKH